MRVVRFSTVGFASRSRRGEQNMQTATQRLAGIDRALDLCELVPDDEAKIVAVIEHPAHVDEREPKLTQREDLVKTSQIALRVSAVTSARAL